MATTHSNRTLNSKKDDQGTQNILSGAGLKQRCLDAGADDVGFVAIDRPEISDQRDDILAVCPAGEEVIGNYQADKKQHLNNVVKPLQKKMEALFVIPNSDAASHGARLFPHKLQRKVGGSLIPQSIAGFFNGLPLVFQRHQSEGLNAVYHFTFTGKENA